MTSIVTTRRAPQCDASIHLRRNVFDDLLRIHSQHPDHTVGVFDSGIHSGYAILSSVTWSVTFFDKRVEAGILGLPTGMLARFLRYAERMELFGPDLGMPHTRAMGGGLSNYASKRPKELAEYSIAPLSIGVSSSCIIS